MRGLVHIAVLSGAALFAATSCAADPAPPPKPAPTAELSPKKVDPGASSVVSEVGGLNEDAMEKAFGEMRSLLEACVEKRRDFEFLGGKMKLSLRIGRDGTARWAYLSETTLGDRMTEKCVLDAATSRAWPAPVGGEGLADKEFSIDPTRQPVEIEADDIRPAIRKIYRETFDCRRDVKGRFLATAYLHPSGRVLSAGVAPPRENVEDAVDCMVERIEKLRFGKLGNRPAKISFELP